MPRSLQKNPRKEFLRAALLGRNSVTDIPVGEHYHRVMKQLGRQEPPQEQSAAITLTLAPVSHQRFRRLDSVLSNS